jgi:uncharacterized membrane protein YedE/YeeE
MSEFTPWSGLAGGLMIGIASAIYLLALGRVAGVSGMLERLLQPTTAGFGIAAMFLVGLPIGALLVAILAPQVLGPVRLSMNVPAVIVAGLLVGFGTRMANGCTSGHGVCGMSRLSARAIAATGIFMVAAMATVFVVRHVL